MTSKRHDKSLKPYVYAEFKMSANRRFEFPQLCVVFHCKLFCGLNVQTVSAHLRLFSCRLSSYSLWTRKA